MRAEFHIWNVNKIAICFVYYNDGDSWTADLEKPIQNNMSQLPATRLLPPKFFKH